MIGQDEDLEGGGILITPQSAYGKALAQWEQFPTTYAPRPGNPYQYRPFPKMVFRAGKFRGKICIDGRAAERHEFRDDNEWARAQEAAERFTASCQMIVSDELELSHAHEDGWRESPQEAVTHAEARETEISTAAAERAYADRNMSELAKREIAEAEDEADGHLAEVPRKPVRRRGRPRKTAN